MYSLNKPHKFGFTLVEMLVTVSIAGMAVLFFGQLLMSDFQRKQWDLIVNDLMTLNRAVSLAYIDSSGLWPGEVVSRDGGCENSNAVKARLEAYLPVFDFEYVIINADNEEESVDRYEFGCSENGFSITTRFLDNDDGDSDDTEAAEYIASGLPIAGAVDEELSLFVIKPRMQYATRVTQIDRQIDDVSNVAVFEKSLITCSNRNISVQPMDVCVSVANNLGGYRVDVSETDDEWAISVLTRTDEEGSPYQPVSECDGEAITIRALLFCQD